MTYTIAIVGHQDRIGRVWDLADQVQARFVTLDPGRIGPGKNHLRAWKYLADNADTDWSVVLEDDAIPVKGFDEQLSEALSVAPEPVVSLYLGTGRPAHWQEALGAAVEHPQCWIVTPALLHHVGVAIKTTMLPLLIDWLTNTDPDVPIDESISLWLRRGQGLQCAYTHPSLVDHDDDLPTTIKARHSIWAGENSVRDVPRKAWLHGTREVWDSSVHCVRRPPLDYRAVIPT